MPAEASSLIVPAPAQRALLFGNGGQMLVVVLVLLSPLLYSIRNLPLPRLYSAALIAALAFVFIGRFRLRPSPVEFALIAFYSLVLLCQPLFLDDIWLKLVLGHAIGMMLMFTPAWAIRALPVDVPGLEAVIVLAMKALIAITVVSIFASWFFDLGEIVYASATMKRAFAWLGDRHTPIIVLQLAIAVLLRWRLAQVLLIACMVMTGGKSSYILAVAMPLLYALLVPGPGGRRFGLLLAVPLLAAGIYIFWDNLSFLVPGVDIAYNSRMLANEVGLTLFREAPFTGIGIDRSPAFVAQLIDQTILSSGIEGYSMPRIHNALLRTAAETGLFGAAALFCLCVTWVIRAFLVLRGLVCHSDCLARRLALGLALWVIGFLLLYQTVDWFGVGENQLAWIVLAVTLAEVLQRRLDAGCAEA